MTPPRSSLPPSPLVPTADNLDRRDKAEPDHAAHMNDAQIKVAIDATITKRLADLGLDDADARADLADLRAGLASVRKIRVDLIQKCLGWFVQAALMLMGLGLLVILSHQ